MRNTGKPFNESLDRILSTGRIQRPGVGYPHVAVAVSGDSHGSLKNAVPHELGVAVGVDAVKTMVVVAGDPSISGRVNGYVKGLVQTKILVDRTVSRIT